MAYFAVADSSLVLAMGKRDIASRTAIYFNVFSAFILGGHGANNHSTCYHGEDRYKYYQKFKFHFDGPLGNSDLPESKAVQLPCASIVEISIEALTGYSRKVNR